MELRDYVRLLRRRWVTIVAVVLACLAGSAAVTLLQPPTYESSTDVLIALPAGGLTDGSLSTGATSTTSLTTLAGTFASLASTPPAVSAAVAASGAPPAGVGVSATVQPGAAVLTVSVVSSNPTTAQLVANAFPTVFPDVLVQLDQLGNRNALTFTPIREAFLPVSPYSPDPVVNTAIGLALGLVLGLGVAVAREALDRRIRDSRGIESRVGVGVLGVVPNELRDEALPTVTHPDSARTEAYRKIRTNLLFSGPEGMLTSLAITSALAGEGKTSLATNLAVVSTLAGQSVALVDADLRKPAVHTALGLENEVGLSNVLAGEMTLDEVARTTENGVTVVTSGPSPRDPSALLERPAFRSLVEELEKHHDLVLVDTTPVLAVSDATQVSAVCRGAVVVSRLRKTTYDSVTRACKTLERVHKPPVGIVAVGHDEDPDAGYRYYYTAPAEPKAGGGSHRKDTDATSSAGGWRRSGSSD